MIRKLSDREHIRQRPAMYIGGVDLAESMEYVLEDNKMVLKSVSYVPGLIKIINELIDNAVDVAIKSDFTSGTTISVNMNETTISVEDNGSGIPIQKVDGHFLPELCWNHARAGSNFDDDENRTQMGMNGVGSYATACFSKKFVGETNDGSKGYQITIKNGAESFTETDEHKGKSKQGTRVTFQPDLDMFGLDIVDEQHQAIIKQRLINLGMSFPQITFKFNKRKISTGTFKSYVKMFSDDFEIYETEDYKFAVLPNEEDDFRQFSYVNGLKIPDGGTHIETISWNVVDGLRTRLVKKYKTIKPGDIKNKLMIIAFLKNFKNPKFNSQSKEKITNSLAETKAYLGDIPYKEITWKLFKNSEIMDPITETYRLKEELARRKELKNADKKSKKKPKSEKFMPPIGDWDNIFLAEGDSAANSISKILGRKGNGFYAMFGVPPNAYDMKLSSIIKSQKLMDLKEIVGLQYSETVQDDINFKNIIITTDFDLPGHFITGQLIGLFMRFGRNLIEEGRLQRLVTPLIVATNAKEELIDWFYTFDEYRAFEKKNLSKKYSYDYRKGLGSWDVEELNIVIQKDGLENMLEVFELDDKAEENIDNWLNGGSAHKRKEMLTGFEFNIMST